MVSSSLMIGNISVPCATWIVDDKPGTSGIWKRLTGVRWVFKLVAGDVMDHLVLLHWVDARCPPTRLGASI
jgi:hypothetical protein